MTYVIIFTLFFSQGGGEFIFKTEKQCLEFAIKSLGDFLRPLQIAGYGPIINMEKLCEPRESNND